MLASDLTVPNNDDCRVGRFLARKDRLWRCSGLPFTPSEPRDGRITALVRVVGVALVLDGVRRIGSPKAETRRACGVP